MKFKMANEPLSIFSFSSLTDIVMLLLIFFLISSQFVVQTGVKVKLPGAKNNEQENLSKLVVSISAENKVFLGSEEIDLNILPMKLEELKAQTNNPNLVLRVDQAASTGTLVKVMDLAKGVQIEKFTILTEKETF